MMNAVATIPTITTEELLSLPQNGMDRWLIEGQLREKPMTMRNRKHSRIMVRTSYMLESWSEKQPKPRGSVLCGEVGCRLRRNPDTTFGIDIIYVSAEVATVESKETTLVDGVPILAIEILSPKDKLEEIHEKIDEYLRAGVALVWVIDPHDRTVTIYRPDAEPVLVNIQQELFGEPHLPGFRVAVRELFA